MIVYYPCADGVCIERADTVIEVIKLMLRMGKVYLDRHSVTPENWQILSQLPECNDDGIYMVCQQWVNL